MFEFQWNALRVGDRVAVHDDLDDGFELAEGVVHIVETRRTRSMTWRSVSTTARRQCSVRVVTPCTCCPSTAVRRAGDARRAPRNPSPAVTPDGVVAA